MGREVGGGIGMGKTCEPKAFSFQCVTKFTTNKKIKIKIKLKKKKNEQLFSLSVSAGQLWFSWPQLGLTEQLSGHKSAGFYCGFLVCSPDLL